MWRGSDTGFLKSKTTFWANVRKVGLSRTRRRAAGLLAGGVEVRWAVWC